MGKNQTSFPYLAYNRFLKMHNVNAGDGHDTKQDQENFHPHFGKHHETRGDLLGRHVVSAKAESCQDNHINQ